MVRVEFTLRRFPVSGSLKDKAGLPFGCVFQPFARTPELPLDGAALEPAAAIARCKSCYAYVNCFCTFGAAGWTCALCGKHQDYTHATGRRYNVRASQRQALPEVARELFEALVEEPLEVVARADEALSSPAPIHLALIDTSGDDDFMELVRSALLAALEALPASSLVGIITFSNKIGLHDVKARVPCVRYMALSDGQPLMMALEELMPLTALLAPVGVYKEALTSALESLISEPGSEAESSGTAAGSRPAALQVPGQDSMMRSATPAASRAFGPTLQAVLEYCRALQSPPFSTTPTDATATALCSPAKIMVFLSGAPDMGVGRLVTPAKRKAPTPLRAPQQPSGPAASGLGSSPAPASGPAGGTGSAATAAAASSSTPPKGGSDGGALPDMVAARLFSGPMDEAAWLQDISPATRLFYEQAAVASASLGVCIDLYAVSSTAVGLQVLQPLCNSTGGAIYLYRSIEESALPQDLYRRLSTPQASAGILRVRTSPGFRVTNFFGRLFADPQLDNLHHLVSCDAGDTFAADFGFESQDGFSSTDPVAPTIQIAFQYTVAALVRCAPAWPAGGPSSATAAAAGTSGGPSGPPGNDGVSNSGSSLSTAGRETPRLVIQRRLRVATYRLNVCRDVAELYQFANPAATVSLLMHKIMRAARTEGASEARMLLRDWLTILAANHHRSAHKGARPEQLPELPVDLSFGDSQALQPLPRLVYALLRSPLLALPADGQHPDLTTFLEHLWSCLPPQELTTAIYPVLSSYGNPDTQAYSRHSLSRTALTSSAAPIFLLDAYIIIMVFYAARAPADMAFPPPQQSALRKAIGAIRHERRITPQVRVVREGTPDAHYFMQLLLDEPQGHMEQEGDATTSAQQPFGLLQFVELIRAEAVALLRTDEATAPTNSKR